MMGEKEFYQESSYLLNNCPLTNEEFNEYFKKFKNGDENARRILIEANLRLVQFTVKTHFKITPYEFGDLFSIGTIGLIKALNKFDLEKGFKFSSYAVVIIKNEIIRHIQKNNENFSGKISFQDKYMTKSNNFIALGDYFIPKQESITEIYEEQELKTRVMELVNLLPELNKEIILCHYGFHDKLTTLRELGSRHNMTKQNVSIILLSSLKFIQDALIEEGYTINSEERKKGKSINKKKLHI